ncbi:arsinothricin resistance N-acetyltransferase ArsN1 family A [Litchfieldia salsa]|uniref:Phosphinothricin acetyltransferase n=1 Tax=Litchfieldia salsa TaxID=930152 RepID=A0A1H0WTY7_9BACI|nr:arsinothricin resistance N-acetyltransferase ArsN1 family A [Litchfieldia salsa]SDP93895.1 phosphinothricin acetyltransferase [Litchfieldia salsa]
MDVIIREAVQDDIASIQKIYNQGIEDRIATLETELKDSAFMQDWFDKHQGRYQVIIIEYNNRILGWASLNVYNPREAYKGVADLSIYIDRDYRGKGLGGKLIDVIEGIAVKNLFHKIVLSTFNFNKVGQALYRKKGYREVGVFKNQGILDDKFVDVMVMEKLL